MGYVDLAIGILQEIGHGSMQHAGAPTSEPRRMLAAFNTGSACFDADHLDVWIFQKWMEETDRVTPAADTRHQVIRQSAFCRHDLSSRFPSDHRLKISDHHGIRMRTQHRPQTVVGRTYLGGPISHGLISRILQPTASSPTTGPGTGGPSNPSHPP